MPAKYFHPNTLPKKNSAPLHKSDVGEMFVVERIVDKRIKVGVQIPNASQHRMNIPKMLLGTLCLIVLYRVQVNWLATCSVRVLF